MDSTSILKTTTTTIGSNTTTIGSTTTILPTHDHLFKILLLGDAGVGKSSFLLRYCEDTYTDNLVSTIGVDFKTKDINLDGLFIKLQLWDFLLNPRFNIKIPYKGSQGILIFFDLTDKDSYRSSKHWLLQVQRYSTEYAVLALVGTKLDLIDLNLQDRAVPFEEAQEFAASNDIDYIECSSKYNINIDQCINKISTRIYIDIIKSLQTLANQNLSPSSSPSSSSSSSPSLPSSSSSLSLSSNYPFYSSSSPTTTTTTKTITSTSTTKTKKTTKIKTNNKCIIN